MSPRLPDNTNRLLRQAFSSFKVWTLYPLTLDISGQKIESSQTYANCVKTPGYLLVTTKSYLPHLID